MDNYNTFKIKRLIKRILYYSGIPYILLHILYFIAYNFCKTPGTRILYYHSINDLNNTMIFNANIIETENFIKQMKYLKKNYNVISLEYFVNNYKRLSNSKNVVITFDDGYKDNFINAYPMLKRYNLPATLFLAIDCVDTGKTKFEDKLTYFFLMNNISSIVVSSLNLKKTLKDNNERNEMLKFICYSINKLDNRERENIINEIYNKYNIEKDNLYGIMLTWDDIKQMDRNLISFSSHSFSHVNLTKLDNEKLTEEIHKSKSILDNRIGSSVRGFSFPFGEFDRNVIRELQDAGYRYAVTTVHGVNNNDIDLFQLKRIPVMNNFHLFKFSLIRQSGKFYKLYAKLAKIYFEENGK